MEIITLCLLAAQTNLSLRRESVKKVVVEILLKHIPLCHLLRYASGINSINTGGMPLG